MPDACVWLGPQWLNLGFSLVLTGCELRAPVFVTSYLIIVCLFLFIISLSVMMHCISKDISPLCLATTESRVKIWPLNVRWYIITQMLFLSN